MTGSPVNEPAAVESSAAPEQERPEPPRPTFDLLPLSDEVRRALAEMAYVHPTPVQLAVWDPATRGKDAVVQARTGTGKTASFGLPLIDHVIKRSIEGVQALVLCPTRELAVQVSTEIDRLATYKGTKSIAIYGGASMERQVSALEEGAQLVVRHARPRPRSPPARHSRPRTSACSCSTSRRDALDGLRARAHADPREAPGEPADVAVLRDAPAGHRAHRALAAEGARVHHAERRSRRRAVDPALHVPRPWRQGRRSCPHHRDREPGERDRVLQHEGSRPRRSPRAAARGYDADWLNGDLAQSSARRSWRATREGKLRFLVATDVAARGIDISHLTHVINFDFPQDAESYVHRTGRTGRAGRTGTAISLVTPQDIGGLYLLRLTYKIRPIERRSRATSELKTRAEADLVVLAMFAKTRPATHEVEGILSAPGRRPSLRARRARAAKD
jgi:ATP-dependent RNA helicase DeaD